MLLELLDDVVDGLVHAALHLERADAGDDGLEAFVVDGFGHDGRGGGAVVTLMLTAAVEPTEPLVVLPPVAAAAEPAEPEPGTILVDKDGRLARDGNVVGLEALGTTIAIEKRTDIRLRADRELSVGMLLTIRERLAAAGVRRLQLVVVRP